jgi:hypothetical protein
VVRDEVLLVPMVNVHVDHSYQMVSLMLIIHDAIGHALLLNSQIPIVSLQPRSMHRPTVFLCSLGFDYHHLFGV